MIAVDCAASAAAGGATDSRVTPGFKRADSIVCMTF